MISVIQFDLVPAAAEDEKNLDLVHFDISLYEQM